MDILERVRTCQGLQLTPVSEFIIVKWMAHKVKQRSSTLTSTMQPLGYWYMSHMLILLHRDLSKNGHDLTVLNHHINSTIDNAVTSTSTNLDINRKQTKCSNEYTADLAIDFRNDASGTEMASSTQEFICPICKLAAREETILCNECGSWLHYDCARVTTSAIKTLNDRDYICTLCTDNLLYGDQADHTAEETNQVIS